MTGIPTATFAMDFKAKLDARRAELEQEDKEKNEEDTRRRREAEAKRLDQEAAKKAEIKAAAAKAIEAMGVDIDRIPPQKSEVNKEVRNNIMKAAANRITSAQKGVMYVIIGFGVIGLFGHILSGAIFFALAYWYYVTVRRGHAIDILIDGERSV